MTSTTMTEPRWIRTAALGSGFLWFRYESSIWFCAPGGLELVDALVACIADRSHSGQSH